MDFLDTRNYEWSTAMQLDHGRRGKMSVLPHHHRVFNLNRWPYFRLYAHEKRCMRREAAGAGFYVQGAQNTTPYTATQHEYLDSAEEEILAFTDKQQWEDSEVSLLDHYQYLRDSYVYVFEGDLEDLREKVLPAHYLQHDARIYRQVCRNMAWMWRWKYPVYREDGEVIPWETLRRWRIYWLHNVLENRTFHRRSTNEYEMERDVKKAYGNFCQLRDKFADRRQATRESYVRCHAEYRDILEKAKRLTCVLCGRIALIPAADLHQWP